MTNLNFNFDQEQKLKKWIANKILTVVMTKGSGLPGTPEYNYKPKKIFESYEKYETWAISKINKYHNKYGTCIDDPIEENWENYDENFDVGSDGMELIENIFPMYSFDEDDSDRVDKISLELLDILDWNWWRIRLERRSRLTRQGQIRQRPIL